MGWSRRLHVRLRPDDALRFARPRRLAHLDRAAHRRPAGGLHVDQVVAIRRALALHEHHVALDAETPRPCNATRHVEYTKEALLAGRGRELDESGRRRAFRRGRRQRALPVDPDVAPLSLQDRPLVEQLDPLSLLEAFEHLAHDAGGDGALDPPDPAVSESGDEALEKAMAETATVAGGKIRFLGGEKQAAREPHGIARTRRQRCLVEIVDVEVVEAIAALERPEILEVQVAA